MAEWMAYLGKVTPVAQITTTSGSAHEGAWGSVNDDTVWLVHSMSTADAASIYRAVDGLMASDTGEKFPGQAHLFATVAGGGNARASHLIALGFKSQAEMEEWNEMTFNSADRRALRHSLSVIADYHGANLLLTQGSWGKSSKSVLSR